MAATQYASEAIDEDPQTQPSGNALYSMSWKESTAVLSCRSALGNVASSVAPAAMYTLPNLLETAMTTCWFLVTNSYLRTARREVTQAVGSRKLRDERGHAAKTSRFVSAVSEARASPGSPCQLGPSDTDVRWRGRRSGPRKQHGESAAGECTASAPESLIGDRHLRRPKNRAPAGHDGVLAMRPRTLTLTLK